MVKSEYGQGLIVNLVKFAEHFENDLARRIYRWNFFTTKLKSKLSKLEYYDIDFRRTIKYILDVDVKVERELHPKESQQMINKRVMSHLIKVWANGASDHLIDIQIPENFKNTVIGKKIAELQKLGLTIGHGYVKTIWTFKDFEKLIKLTEEIALLIDKKLGLKADLGKY